MLGNVVHCQQNHFEIIDAAGADHQAPVSQGWKILLDFEVRERVGALEKTVQRIAQAGKVPTAAGQ